MLPTIRLSPLGSPIIRKYTKPFNAFKRRGMYPNVSKCNAKRCVCCTHLCIKATITSSVNGKYEGCSNMNASSFITVFTNMLRQNGKRFFKGQYVTCKLAPGLKKNTEYLSSYSPLNEGYVSILTNSMLRTYTSDRDECIILR